MLRPTRTVLDRLQPDSWSLMCWTQFYLLLSVLPMDCLITICDSDQTLPNSLISQQDVFGAFPRLLIASVPWYTLRMKCRCHAWPEQIILDEGKLGTWRCVGWLRVVLFFPDFFEEKMNMRLSGKRLKQQIDRGRSRLWKGSMSWRHCVYVWHHRWCCVNVWHHLWWWRWFMVSMFDTTCGGGFDSTKSS